MSWFRSYKERLSGNIGNRTLNKSSVLAKAIKWIKNNRIPGGGIACHHRKLVGYAEVTGYIIPTLYNCGERELARELVRWEAAVQNPDGAFCAIDDVPYTFDTAQVIRGFLSALDDMPEIEENLRRACDYVEMHIAPNGEVLSQSYDMWRLSDGSIQSEYSNLYVLPPMREAGRKLSEPKYLDAYERGMNYFKKKADLVQFKSGLGTNSHFFGYIMEALVDLGEIELAKKGLEQAAEIQKENGAIPAYPGVDWVCSAGMAQIAVAWYKIGDNERANKAIDYLARVQNSSGGFWGSYGRGGRYFRNEEISWAVKFFIDAVLWMIKTDFNVDVDLFPDFIEEEDGQVQEILSFFGDLKGKKVIDVGCGKGRFLKILRDKFPECQLYGLDVSEKLLNFCPRNNVSTSTGTMLNIGFPDAFFDCIYSIEALEHAVLVENAIREMVRVLKPGGKIDIIDKNVAKLGVLQIKPWEKWFKPKEITNLLRKHGVEAQHKFIGGGEFLPNDRLFVAWKGLKKRVGALMIGERRHTGQVSGDS